MSKSIVHAPLRAHYAEGTQLAALFVRELRAAEVLSVPAILNTQVGRYVAILEGLRTEGTESLRGEFFDLIPRNIFVAAGDRFVEQIDQEWVRSDDVPLTQLLYRAAVSDFTEIMKLIFPSLDFQDALWNAVREYGLTDELSEFYAQDEQAFQRSVSITLGEGRVSHGKFVPMESMLSYLKDANLRLVEERDYWQNQFTRLRARRVVRAALRVSRLLGRAYGR